MRPSSRAAALCASLAALALLPSCASKDSDATSSNLAHRGDADDSRSPAPAPAGPQTKNWFDLKAGDCLTEIPAVDTGAVDNHGRRLRDAASGGGLSARAVAVNTAINQVAMEKCAKGFVDYTGQPFVGGPFAVTYLIDSNQDRTANNPTPSTAICFLPTPMASR